MTISAAEQYFIELTNRARLNPEAEAARYGINLNDNLSPGTISSAPKQVLAANELLEDAAIAHSQWMLAADTFSHTGSGGSSPGDRMSDAGYNFTGSWTWGENISWRGTTGTINLEASIESHYQGLFESAGHRKNTLNGSFREIGIGQVKGDYRYNGTNYDASMLTTKFAKSGSEIFVTGVVYDDTNNDNFYSMGEGDGGVTFSSGGQSDTSAASGGYALGLTGGGTKAISISGGGVSGNVSVDLSNGNVKLDVVDGSLVLVSSDATLNSGLDDARLLGIADLNLTGHNGANTLTGNHSDNVLTGRDGADVLNGWQGDDTLYGNMHGDTLNGHAGRDMMYGGYGNDTMSGGDGNDTLRGNEGWDVMQGNAGADVMDGHQGNDTMNGGDGNDTVRGGNGGDELRGGNGDDNVNGAAGWDRLYGGQGNDKIWAGNGNDTAYGGGGNDRIIAGKGADVLSGGSGTDTFVFKTGDGNNRITDFDATNGDRLDLSGVSAFSSAADAIASANEGGSGTTISDGAGFTLLLEGVAFSDLDNSDFV